MRLCRISGHGPGRGGAAPCLAEIALWAALGGLLAGCGDFFVARTGSGGSSSPKFLFVANLNQPDPALAAGAGSVTGFTINSDGTLGSAATFSTGGNGADGLAIDPAGKFLYVSNDDGRISGFAIHSSGTLLTAISGLPLTGRPSVLNPSGAIVDPVSTAHFLYVANFGSANVSAFAYDASAGGLTELAGSPYDAGAAAAPSAITMDPAGKLLFVAAGAVGTVGFKVNSDGTLNLGSRTTIPPTAGATSEDVLVDPAGKFLYVANGVSGVSAYSISLDASGNPGFSQLPNSPFSTAGTNPVALARTPGGALLYASNHDSNNVAGFNVRGDGTLLAATRSPFPAGSSPAGLKVASSGAFLYVTNVGARDSNGTGGISLFKIDAATGNLTANGNADSGGRNPNALAVTP